jgi:oligopeptide/dipeptide ABC transporter ATP-binding protein
VLIAMALVAAPYLVIADEPTSALDATVKVQVLNVLMMIKDEFNVAMMVVSHDASVIAELADRVAIMYSGRIVEVGDVVQIFHNPKHPYTRGLMASCPTMMMMRSAGKTRPRLQGIPGAPPDLRNIPAGCSFHPRCPHVTKRCVEYRPELRTDTPDHQIACHHSESINEKS